MQGAAGGGDGAGKRLGVDSVVVYPDDEVPGVTVPGPGGQVMPRLLCLLSAALLLLALPLPGRAHPAAAADTAEDEQLLKDARVGTDGPGLLECFRKRTPTDRDRERAAALIRRLSEDAFAVRQKAAEG